jgi:hypothetical protein
MTGRDVLAFDLSAFPLRFHVPPFDLSLLREARG